MAMASVLPSVAAFSGGGGTSSSKPSSSLSFLTLPLASSSSSTAYSAAFPRSLPSFRLRAQPPPMSELDTEAFEADRLRLDAEARLNMKQVAAAAEDGPASEGEGSTVDAKKKKNGDTAVSTEDKEEAGAWKWRIRKRIWDLMERENIAVHPRPVHHRIPNFVGAATAAAKLASLPAFQSAKCVKVNPDTPQKQVRYLTLEGNKKLLTPQPRLRSGFFSELEASSLPPNAMVEACTAIGVAKYGKPLGLDAKLKVDLLVIGSVAVNPKTGARLGKGEGFAELEYAMLRHMGAIDDSTLVVTSVHDKQLVDDIPLEKLKVHDVPVDVICTPTHIIHTKTTIPKPKGIYWELLSPEKLGQILVLRQLKKKIEQETGQKLPQGPSEKLPPTAQRGPRRGTAASEKVARAATKQQPVASSKKGTSKAEQGPIKQQPVASSEKGTSKAEQGQQPVASEKGTEQGPIKEEPVASSETGGSNIEPCIFVWNLDIATTWKELKEHVSNVGAEVVKVNIIRKGNTRPMARVLLKDRANIEAFVNAIDSSQLGASTMRAKISSVRERASQVGESSNGAKVDTVAEKVPEKAIS